MQKIYQDSLLDKQCREIHDQDNNIEEFYTGLYDSEQSTIIHTDPKDVPAAITSWEMEAALGDMKIGTHRDIEKQEKIPSQLRLLSCTLNAYQKDEYPQCGRTLR